MSHSSQAVMHLNPAFAVAPLNRRIFGTFVEHMGRCVYTGIYEPGHETADEHGFRQDVEELVKEMGPTAVRYPGGNFVSGYKWEDGVGPKEDRPVRFDFGWRSIETNQVGTNEFLAWCERVGLEPMLAINLGTRGLAEAMEYLEYVNGQPGTTIADKRVADGRTEPWDVKIWCLGNEMDGPWQMGHKTAHEYGRLAEEVANAYARYDDSMELVVCGSSGPHMPTFGEWERVILEAAFENGDHVSAHAYYEPKDGDLVSFLCCAESMDRQIHDIIATADHVSSTKHSRKKIQVSFDEWNVWYQDRFNGERSIEIEEAPRLIEDLYTVLDAVVVGSLLITLMRNTDRVSMACQAQLVNIIAPIRSEPNGPAWRQTIFHPFALSSAHAKGVVLDVSADSPMIETPEFGPVPQLWSTATWDEESGSLVVFAANRSLDDSLDLDLKLDAFADLEVVEHLMISEDDHSLTNDEQNPDRVKPREGDAAVDGTRLRASLPAVSWHCIRLQARLRDDA